MNRDYEALCACRLCSALRAAHVAETLDAFAQGVEQRGGVRVSLALIDVMTAMSSTN